MLPIVNGLRGRVYPTVWQRRWAVVWNAQSDLRTDPDWLAYHLPRFGYGVVCVKVTDGLHPFAGSHGANLADGFLRPLRRAGLRLTGWGYSYGADAEQEAQLALTVCREHGLQAFVLDAEREYEYDPADSPHVGDGARRYGCARRFVDNFLHYARGIQLGVTSYGRVDLHRLDWASLSRRGVRFCPQAYANESAELAPDLCVKAAEVYWRRGYVHPWLGLYRGALGDGDPAAYLRSLAAAGTRGFAVYLADGCTVGDYQQLAKGR